jgi:Transposase DDE domain
VPYVRTVKTKSGATAVQVVWSSRRGSRKIEHLGSAHDEAELEVLKAAGRQRIAAGQAELDLGLVPAGGSPLPITSSRMGCLLDALERGYRVLGLDAAAGGDGVFRDLVLARIIEPVSKLDSLRVLEEAGTAPPSYRTIERRLPAYAQEEWRQRLSAACAAHARLGPASLVLYDVSTLYFETDAGDGFREPGFSKERRLEPQITIGLLAGQDGFPLMVSAFEGNKAETKTMLPVVKAFMAAHRLPDVTVVADAGMISEANQKAIEAEGLSFILGMKVPDVPYQVDKWRREHPGEEIPDGHVFVQPWPAGPSSKRRDQWIYYQYRADRARRTLRGIDEQVAKAAKAVAGLAPVKRNRFIALDGAVKSVNRELEAKARTLAGIKGYVTNLATCPDGTPVTADFVIGSYHELWNIEKSFRMAKSDLQARPVYHRKRDSIEAHLTIVFAALAVSRWIETRTGWSIRKFVKTARRYRPSRSRPASAPSPPPTRCPTTSAKPSKPSTTSARYALIWPNSGPASRPRRTNQIGPIGPRFHLERPACFAAAMAPFAAKGLQQARAAAK